MGHLGDIRRLTGGLQETYRGAYRRLTGLTGGLQETHRRLTQETYRGLTGDVQGLTADLQETYKRRASSMLSGSTKHKDCFAIKFHLSLCMYMHRSTLALNISREFDQTTSASLPTDHPR